MTMLHSSRGHGAGGQLFGYRSSDRDGLREHPRHRSEGLRFFSSWWADMSLMNYDELWWILIGWDLWYYDIIHHISSYIDWMGPLMSSLLMVFDHEWLVILFRHVICSTHPSFFGSRRPKRCPVVPRPAMRMGLPGARLVLPAVWLVGVFRWGEKKWRIMMELVFMTNYLVLLFLLS